MDKHAYREQTERMLGYMRQGLYEQAMKIADAIDWRKVKNVSMLCAVSEVYEANKEYEKSRDILFQVYDRSPESRKIVYRLGTLALKLGDVKEATDCYEEFVALAPKDPNRYVFHYKILRMQNAPLDEQIEALEEFKKVEYVEKWAFELAKLYQEAGRMTECLEECDDLILWFSEGEYVYKAMDLKMQYKPLTPQQQEKYDHRFDTPAEEPTAVAATEELTEELAAEAPAEPAAPAEEPTAAAATEEEPEPVITDPEPIDEAPKASIEEMLQEWEEKQKENAELIRVEYEKAEQEKAEQEKAEQEETEQEGDEEILSDDIRQLMEALESESADIEAQKMKQETPNVPRAAVIAPAEPRPIPELLPEPGGEDPAAEAPAEPEPEEEANGESPSFAARSAVPVPDAPVAAEAGGIRLGDTNSMAAVAKALKNNIEAELPEEEEPYEEMEKSPYDTGFIVKGRYDLDAQSEVGLKAGLTEEQKKLFSYFVPVHGMSEQLVEVLEKDRTCKSRYGTSRIGNVVIIGRRGSGKTVLAVDVVKAIQKARKLKQGKVGIVTAEAFNKKDVAGILEKLHGGAIIIERASRLSRRTIEMMCEIMEGQTGELLVVLEDERKPMERMLAEYPQFAKKFTSRLEVPVFINDELVTFAQTYAKENGYKVDEMGILALYSRIDTLQREERVVTVSDIKEIMDDAIENSQRPSFRKLVKKIVGRNTDESDRILLREEDFR